MSQTDIVISKERLQESLKHDQKNKSFSSNKVFVVQNAVPEAAQPALDSNEKCSKPDASSSTAAKVSSPMVGKQTNEFQLNACLSFISSVSMPLTRMIS